MCAIPSQQHQQEDRETLVRGLEEVCQLDRLLVDVLQRTPHPPTDELALLLNLHSMFTTSAAQVIFMLS